jgi:hypothetical protein
MISAHTEFLVGTAFPLIWVKFAEFRHNMRNSEKMRDWMAETFSFWKGKN